VDYFGIDRGCRRDLAKVEDEQPLPKEKGLPKSVRGKALVDAFGPDTIRGFLVETDRPGFRAEDIHGKWSLRASVTSSLSMQDVHVPECNLMPKTAD